MAQTPLEKLGFTPASGAPARKRLIICSQGKEKEGKSHWALTAPAPIIIFNIDVGLEGVVERYKSAGKEIYVEDFPIPKELRKNPAAMAAASMKEWTKFTTLYERALESSLQPGGCRTIIWDTATEFWELARLARFGKLEKVMPHNYTEVNAEFSELIRQAYNHNANLILLHKVKKEYVNEQATGKMERAGFKDMGFLAQVVIEHSANAKAKKLEEKFKVKVISCRQNTTIENEVYSVPPYSFPFLACEVIEGSSPDEWE